MTIQFHVESDKRMLDWNYETAQFQTNSLVSQFENAQAEGARFAVLFRIHTGRLVRGQELVDVIRLDPTEWDY